MRRSSVQWSSGRWPAVALAVILVLTSCGGPPSPPAPGNAATPGPDPARVDQLILLAGDPGVALPGDSDVLAAVAADVEAWAPRLAPGRVAVAYLGDLIYPVGLRPAEHSAHVRDSTRLHAQLGPLIGPSARAHGTEGWFLAGNHDWGHDAGPEGAARLRVLAERIDAWRAAGHPTTLRPTPGTIGPAHLDIGARHRIVFLDSHAWLGGDEAARTAAGDWLAALVTGTDRSVTVLAHHPLLSAGEHGASPPLSTGFGIQALVSRAGLIAQDASSRPYRRMIRDVRAAFAERAPLAWASGHDHTLQLLTAPGPDWPAWMIVSGATSKTGRLGRTDDLVAGGRWPGHARLFLLDDGTAFVHLVAVTGGTTTVFAAHMLATP